VYETVGVTEVLVAKKKKKKKTVTHIHKKLQNVCLSVLLIKALSFILHKLQVLQKAKQSSVIHLNTFIQNDQWITDMACN
jgi:hypothetical protein